VCGAGPGASRAARARWRRRPRLRPRPGWAPNHRPERAAPRARTLVHRAPRSRVPEEARRVTRCASTRQAADAQLGREGQVIALGIVGL
jgi:hypothetical protein